MSFVRYRITGFFSKIKIRFSLSTRTAVETQKFWILVSVVLDLFVFSTFFWYAYSRASPPGIPIGWDTGYYVRTIMAFRESPLFSVVTQLGSHDFLYPLLVSFIPLSPETIETYSPMVLLALTVLSFALLSRLGKRDVLETSLLLISLGTWFSLFRIATDLNSELMGLSLATAGVAFGIRAIDRNSLLDTGIASLFLLMASFAHVETADFFFVIFAISSVIAHGKKCVIPMTLAFCSIVPANLAFLIHELSLFKSYGGVIPYYQPDPLSFWLISVGLLLPFALAFMLFFIADFRNNSKNHYLIFLVAWLIAAFLLGITQYFIPAFETFSERAILLLPVPLLAAIAIKTLLVDQKYRRVVIIVFCFLFLFSSYSATSAVINENYANQWIPPAAVTDLNWLSTHFQTQEPPIFVVNDRDLVAGGNANLWDNWIQNIYGNHFTYLGQLTYLAEFERTPFTAPNSQAISSQFFSELLSSGISRNSITSHSVLVITAFYPNYPFSLYANFSSEIHPGVYLINTTSLIHSTSLFLDAALIANSYEGDWYTIPRNWTLSGTALEYYATKPEASISVTFPVLLGSGSNFRIGLRLLDGSSGEPFQLFLNGSLVLNLYYNGTNRPVIVTVPRVIPGPSIAYLKFQLPYIPRLSSMYASIDSVTINYENST